MIKPVGKRLLVQQIPEIESENGIVLPQSFSDKKANRYRVLAVGERCEPDIRKGGVVILHSRRLAVGNVREAQIIEQDQVLAIEANE